MVPQLTESVPVSPELLNKLHRFIADMSDNVSPELLVRFVGSISNGKIPQDVYPRLIEIITNAEVDMKEMIMERCLNLLGVGVNQTLINNIMELTNSISDLETRVNDLIGLANSIVEPMDDITRVNKLQT